MLSFACISPHAPIFLPDTGSAQNRKTVEKTIKSLEKLGTELDQIKPEKIIISSPHPDWGFDVPLHFLTRDIKNIEVEEILTDLESPMIHFERGRQIAKSISSSIRVAWIASGDMSHVLKENGPYGFHPSGPLFDKTFVNLLKNKDIDGILNLDASLVEDAAQCGLRSFCMVLGALTELKIDWQPEVLSYEGPFGVGYLVARLL